MSNYNSNSRDSKNSNNSSCNRVSTKSISLLIDLYY